MIRYWEFPDEFAANVWVINFINEHIDLVEKLVNVCMRDWANLVNEVDVFTLISEE